MDTKNLKKRVWVVVLIIVGIWLINRYGLQSRHDIPSSYSCEGNWIGLDPHQQYPCANAVDGNWDSFAVPGFNTGDGVLYQIYNTPDGAVSANWTVKVYVWTLTGTYATEFCFDGTNYIPIMSAPGGGQQIGATYTVAIPSNCLYGSTLQMKSVMRYTSESTNYWLYETKVDWEIAVPITCWDNSTVYNQADCPAESTQSTNETMTNETTTVSVSGGGGGGSKPKVNDTVLVHEVISEPPKQPNWIALVFWGALIIYFVKFNKLVKRK